MIDDFKLFIRREDLFHASDRILLAVSGGLDSIVMVSLFRQAGFNFAIAHANFQLRGEESFRDEEFVRRLAESHKVEFFVRKFDTTGFSRSEKISIQVAARQIRYQWFDELLVKHGFDFIATAHHLDDQVETFLINLTRGTGIAGLHGILPKQGKLVRPMLFAYRSEIESYATENNLEFVEDSSNRGDKYLRNRIRHKIIPGMEKISPGFSRELNQTIGFIRDAEIIYRQAIEQKRKEIFDETEDRIYIKADQFFSLKPLVSWAYELFSPYGFNLSNAVDIAGLAGAIPGKEIRSSTFRLIRDREQLILAPAERKGREPGIRISMDDLSHKDLPLPLPLIFEISEKVPSSLTTDALTALIDMDKLTFPVELRKWRKGDYFVPLGMSQAKKLSDFFIDLKLSKIEKEKTWLLCSNNDIVWVIGLRLDDRYKITKASGRILKIRIKPG